MHFAAQRERFRAILAGDRCVHPASVYDAISARIAEDLGFETGMFAGSVASLAIIGAPDITLITLTEFAEQAYRICRAGNLPVLVDADHGYGNALNVMRTVEELETAGVSALTIEDTVLPAPFGSTDTALISTAEAVKKMAAAVRARRDPSLVIVGRTQAAIYTGIEDAVVRAKAFAQTGVDALFFTGIKERAQLEAIRAAVTLPIMLGGAGPAFDRDYLAANNVRISLQPHLPFAAAVQATYATLKALRDGTPPGKIEGAPAPELIERVTRAADYAAWSAGFLKPE